MYLFRKNHGAISVFLILILVPCMLVSSIFVDISRVQLSKAVAESSAELALNTLKTYYDYDLSRYYGLMGSCQNISDYYETVMGYYDQALHSRDVEDDELELLYQRVYHGMAGRFSDETISDLLLVNNKTEGAGISAVEGANMNNPTILQQQIVEFMKYRGPIVIVEELIALLKKEDENGSIKAAEESSRNEPLLKAQEKYYRAESELLQEANKSYWALRTYTEEADKAGFVTSTFQSYGNRIQACEDTYREIHNLMIKNLYNTAGLGQYARPAVALDKYHYSKEDEEISYLPTPEPVTTPDPSTAPADSTVPISTPPPAPEYHVKGDKVKALAEALENAVNDFNTSVIALTAAGSDLMANQPGPGENDAYKIQWWVRMNARINSPGGGNLSAKVEKAGDEMIKAYAKICAMLECVPDNGYEDFWWKKAESLKHQAESLQAAYLDPAGSGNSSYMKMVRLLETVSQSTGELRHENLSVSVNGEQKPISDALAAVSSDLRRMREEAERFQRYLRNIIDGNNQEDIPSLDKIKSLIGKYKTSLNAWEDRAGSTDTSLGGEHREDIEEIRNGAAHGEGAESERIAKEITEQDLDMLKERLENIYSQFQAVIDAVDSVQYGNRKGKDIPDYDTFYSAAAGQIQGVDIPLVNRELNDYADGRFQVLFRTMSEQTAATLASQELSHSPMLHYTDGRDDVPQLYRKYYSLFRDKSPSDVEGAKNRLNSKKDASDSKADEIQNQSRRYHGPEGRNITDRTDRADDGFSLFDGLLGGITGMARSLLALEMGDLRDRLYVTEYIMNMFSYATFENENYFDLVKEKGQSGSLHLAGKAYLQVYGQEAYRGAADKEHTWLSERPEDGYNKTLTNEMINVANNYAYLAEIEYILFGADNETSVKEAYKMIYGIRYLLNLVSAFSNFWGAGGSATGSAINGIATGLASATGFIIPVPLVKITLLAILTVFETGMDMDRLEAGFPVELYKGKEDWWVSLNQNMSLDDFFNALSGGGGKAEQSHGLRYSDYLTFFVYLGLNSDRSAQGIYQRMGDVIEKNMQLRTGEENYSLEKTQVYFQIKTKLRVEPLMLTLPYYSDYVDDPAMGDDWCTFEVDTIRGY